MDNKNNEKEQKGIISSFIDYYLSKLKISIDEIELIAFNYEITNKNLKDLKRSALEIVRNEENYGG